MRIDELVLVQSSRQLGRLGTLSLSLSLYVKTTISMSVAQYSVCDLYLALPRLLEPLPALSWPTDATPYFPPGQVLSWSGKFCAFCPDKVF